MRERDREREREREREIARETKNEQELTARNQVPGSNLIPASIHH